MNVPECEIRRCHETIKSSRSNILIPASEEPKCRLYLAIKNLSKYFAFKKRIGTWKSFWVGEVKREVQMNDARRGKQDKN